MAPSNAPFGLPVVPARPAATTLVLRDGAAGLEVLMVRRSLQASFMPGAYVFPGGAVDAADALAAPLCDEPAAALAARIGRVAQVGEQALAFAVGGLRECFEECGLWLGAASAGAADWPALRARLHGGEPLQGLAAAAGLRLHTSVLQPFSHWVTPLGLPKRFDTLFFVALAPPGQVPEVDAGETTTLAWVNPAQALDDRRRGEFPMEFATVSTVRQLLPFGSAAALLAHAAGLSSLPPLHPRLTLGADGRPSGVLLPGQPGYDDLWGDG
ncbi:NUDIX hydrolase [Aquabacterium sp. OR-4]|uniref:NUDIX hydrolase n=1 Tax=Aquabacterium sp. OR-4 TaxID=2978127 RepID=UPI0021B23007|nr:NUDIX hydrolase [Aquabacterium sp. OR-4]MDT7838446.1 NUDIX hydrolase [Aquabacterium sp. OR-4]